MEIELLLLLGLYEEDSGATAQLTRVIKMQEEGLEASFDGMEDGKMIPFIQAGKIFVVGKIRGKLYAAEGRCTHMQCLLAEGWLDGHKLTCGGHLSEFDLTTGSVLKGPAKGPLKIYPVVVENGKIRIQT